LDPLPGEKISYASWQTQLSSLQKMLSGARKIAMQYSPDCGIPYVSMVDAGTVELIRSLNVEVVSSANLIQIFEARWTAEQYKQHELAGKKVDAIRKAAFERIRSQLDARVPVDEF